MPASAISREVKTKPAETAQAVPAALRLRAALVTIMCWCCTVSLLQAQKSPVVTTATGQTEFSAKAAGPAADIYGIEKTGKARFDPVTGEVEVKIDMRRFSLPKKLMQKHYNERYMETDKYPYATFKGRVSASSSLETEGEHKVKAVGALTVHGVTRPREITGIIHTKGKVLTFTAAFTVPFEAHGVTVPVLFFTRIAEAVEVKVNYRLEPE